ncbi:hypothetical protein ACT3TE_11045 [Brachybacterium sp. AOP42-B2-9]|uniref:hypothetical protein n=1 Tax=Brachybacterium sp. AOP42-B2-9 TaxID=3457672 RepID=UPI004033C329
MTTVSIIGTGAMANAIHGILTKGGAEVELIGHAEVGTAPLGSEVVFLAARYLVSTPMDGVWSLGRVWLCCPAINGPGGVAARSRDTR